jgi:hypothetical protein
MNYVYAVTAWDGVNETACTHRAGQFDFVQAAGLPGDTAVDDIAIPLDVSDVIADAEGLANWAETHGAAPFGTVRQLLRWEAQGQYFLAWSHEFGFGYNFSLQPGDYLLMVVDENMPELVSLVGRVPEAGEVSFNLAAGLAYLCGLNFVSLPLDHPEITNADELSDAIGGVIQALDWDAATQSFLAWSNEFGFGDNFATTVGYPYIVCLDDTAPAVWP